MTSVRNGPGQPATVEVGWKFHPLLANAELRRLSGNYHGRTAPSFEPAELLLNGCDNRVAIHVPGDHDEKIVRRIFLPVVVVELIPRKLIEEIEVTDHGISAGMIRVCGIE